MKKNLLLFFIFISFVSKGQTSTYRPFPTNYGNWIYQYYDDFGVPTSSFTEYTLNGDTTFASTNYKRMFTSSSYAGAIRESGKIVYFVPDTSTSEFVLYNFNLTVGDTIFSPYGGAVCCNDTVIVLTVDSVLASDGFHRTLELSSFVIWIEGIGSKNYLLRPADLAWLSGNDRLSCAVNDSTNYPSTSISCIVSIQEHINAFENISFYPNPTDDYININNDASTFEYAQFQIYNSIGKLYHQTGFEEMSGSSYKLDLTGIPQGFYMLLKISADGRIGRAKVVVK